MNITGKIKKYWLEYLMASLCAVMMVGQELAAYYHSLFAYALTGTLIYFACCKVYFMDSSTFDLKGDEKDTAELTYGRSQADTLKNKVKVFDRLLILYIVLVIIPQLYLVIPLSFPKMVEGQIIYERVLYSIRQPLVFVLVFIISVQTFSVFSWIVNRKSHLEDQDKKKEEEGELARLKKEAETKDQDFQRKIQQIKERLNTEKEQALKTLRDSLNIEIDEQQEKVRRLTDEANKNKQGWGDSFAALQTKTSEAQTLQSRVNQLEQDLAGVEAGQGEYDTLFEKYKASQAQIKALQLEIQESQASNEEIEKLRKIEVIYTQNMKHTQTGGATKLKKLIDTFQGKVITLEDGRAYEITDNGDLKELQGNSPSSKGMDLSIKDAIKEPVSNGTPTNKNYTGYIQSHMIQVNTVSHETGSEVSDKTLLAENLYLNGVSKPEVKKIAEIDENEFQKLKAGKKWDEKKKILRLINEGKTDQEVYDKIGISKATYYRRKGEIETALNSVEKTVSNET